MLVVIAIIAILASIAFPVFAKVRARADSTACAANLHQLGTAIAAYTNENDNSLPGPLNIAQLPTYSLSDPTQLGGFLAKYLNLPVATGTAVKVPIMMCPAYVKSDPVLDKPVYAIDPVQTYQQQVYVFGSTLDASKPMKLASLTEISDPNQKPLSLSSILAMRDYLVSSSATLVTNVVTYNSNKPVHSNILNALYFDWHVGLLNATTLQPQ